MPQRIAVTISRSSGASYKIRSEPGQVVYQSSERRDGMTVGADLAFVVGGEKWEEFWRAMDAIRVWEWEERYDDAEEVTATVWSVALWRNGRQLDASGRNRFPPSFDRFCSAVSNLLDGQSFG